MELSPRGVLRILSLLAIPALAALAARTGEGDDLVPLAGDVPAGELAFEVRATGGALLPARLTFVPEGGGIPTLFTAVEAAPRELAARKNIVYSRSGRGRITVPVGRYTVYATHGPEWGLGKTDIDVRPGEAVTWSPSLAHEVDTKGWVCGDFHLHTLTYSGHGDANLLERVLSFLGEGLEFAVATDHNHLTDYGPTVHELSAAAEVTTVTGNEVSTPIGHFNAFPLDPARTPVDAELSDANELFRLMAEPQGPNGLRPVIQLNHPRWDGIDYFAYAGLDPVDGIRRGKSYSPAFDSIEVLNENVGWGYFDPIADGVDTSKNRHSVLRDWFHLLNLGERYAAVGNSDSHAVQEELAGYPRNYVASATDDPGSIDPAAVAAAVRGRRVITTTGPFVEYSVEGVPMGGDVRAKDGHALLSLRVQAASWIDVDRVEVIVNGERVQTIAVPPARTPLRLEQTVELCLLGTCERHGRRSEPELSGPRDAWVALLVEGDDALDPILVSESQPALPLCIANPVWIDGDGDGRWVSPRERIAAELAARRTPYEAQQWFETLGPEERVLALAAVPRGTFGAVLIQHGLESADRGVRLAALRTSERCAVAGNTALLERVWTSDTKDPYLAALCLRALVAARRDLAVPGLLEYSRRFGDALLRRHSDELLELAQGTQVRTWSVVGLLPVEEQAPPTPLASGAAGTGRDGKARAWRELAATEDGFLDLAQLAAPDESADETRAYAEVWLHADAARRVACCLGTDDQGRVWLGEELVYESRERHGAHPLEKLLELPLAPGWNRLVFEVQNKSGEFGLYCRVLDPAVTVAAKPTER